ncbi:hypothetical protein ACHAPJ_001941 [Fusarium lateritium]
MFHVPLRYMNTQRESKLLQAIHHAAVGGDIFLLRDLFAEWDILASQTPESKLAKSGRQTKCKLWQVLMGATYNGDLGIVLFLLDVRGARIHQAPISIAVSRKYWSILRVFIDHGWDINKPTGPDDYPLLGYHLDDAEAIRGLLEAGANPKLSKPEDEDINIPSEAGSTGTVESLKLMREYGVDFKKSNALHWAAGDDEDKGNRIPVMTYLLDEVGIPIDQFDYAYDEGRVIKAVDLCYHNGTALHYAILGKKTENVEFLLSSGADQKVKNLRGETPLDLAQKENWDEGIRLLESWFQHTSPS